MTDLVLASASPRRAELLRSAGRTPQIRPTACDETPRPHEPAVSYACRIAAAKLQAAQQALSAGPESNLNLAVLAADTVVWRAEDAQPIGKPTTRDDALAILERLLGADHFVTTAWALARGDRRMVRHETTRVWMRHPGAATVQDYLATDEWTDKAGGYGIQGTAAGWVTRIEGSYTNVVGLPLAQVLAALDGEDGDGDGEVG